MLWTLALILFVLWLLGTVSAYTMGRPDSRAARARAHSGGTQSVHRHASRGTLAGRGPSAGMAPDHRRRSLRMLRAPARGHSHGRGCTPAAAALRPCLRLRLPAALPYRLLEFARRPPCEISRPPADAQARPLPMRQPWPSPLVSGSSLRSPSSAASPPRAAHGADVVARRPCTCACGRPPTRGSRCEWTAATGRLRAEADGYFSAEVPGARRQPLRVPARRRRQGLSGPGVAVAAATVLTACPRSSIPAPTRGTTTAGRAGSA